MKEFLLADRHRGFSDPVEEFVAALDRVGPVVVLVIRRVGPEGLHHFKRTYREALKRDEGSAMQHGQYHLVIDRSWVEARLKTPFTWK